MTRTPRLFGLPPDLAHILDELVADDLLDWGSLMLLNLFSTPERVEEAMGRAPIKAINRYGFVTVDWRRSMAALLRQLADDEFETVPDAWRGGIVHATLSWVADRSESYANCEAGWAYEDMLTGGAMEPYKKRCAISHAGVPWKRTLRRLHSPQWIARRVKTYPETLEFGTVATGLFKRVDSTPHEWISNDLGPELNRLENDRELRREAGIAQLLAEHRVELKPSQKRKARQVLKRAVRIAAQVLDPADISKFARGEAVRIPGQNFDLVCRPNGSIIDRGSHTMSVSAVAKGESLSKLADLCIYLDDAPVLDQLVGFSLMMRAGEEDQIIQTANLIRTWPAAEDVASIQAKRALAPERLREADEPRRVVDAFSFRGFNAMREAYWQQTKPIWVDRFRVSALGRRASTLRLVA